MSNDNRSPKKSFMQRLKGFNPIGWASLDNLLVNLPFLLFLAFLGVVYIGNIHTAEGTIREIDRAENHLKELRWEYISSKSDLMFKSKMTEVAAAVSELGLKEIKAPPKKIIVAKGEY